ncbi:MAG: hypothetical protein QXL47_04655 [Candidatus Anstonellales archaeon]
MGVLDFIKKVFRRKEEKSLKPEPDTLMEVEHMAKKKETKKKKAGKKKCTCCG